MMWCGTCNIHIIKYQIIPSCSSVFPAISLGFTILGAIFAYVPLKKNSTIEVVTFCLCGWCMLGVFLLLAFTHLRYECQDLWSLCDGMLVCIDKTLVYTLIRKSSKEWSQNPC